MYGVTFSSKPYQHQRLRINSSNDIPIPPMKSTWTSNSQCLLLLALMCCGCSTYRPLPEPSPQIHVLDRYTEDTEETENKSDQDLPSASWWLSFNDQNLNRLIAAGLDQNLELQALAARIERAQAIARQAGAKSYPAITGIGSYEKEWNSQEDASTSSTSIGALFSWELDFLKRIRYARESRQYEWQAAAYDWVGSRLVLSAAITDNYFAMLEHRRQLQLIADQIAINERLLTLTRLRFGQGVTSIVDVRQQQVQLAEIRARIPEEEAQLEHIKYALNVLLGQPPGALLELSPRELPSPLPLPSIGLPADLIHNRPDLLAAKSLIIAIDRRVGEALADRFPRFTIDGALLISGDPSLHHLIGNTLAAVTGPIFDADERQSEVAARQAELAIALAHFSHAYLVAVQEVETALLRERKQEDKIRLLNHQLESAQRLLSETRNRYSQGLNDYLPVLNAVTTVQNLEREIITSRRELLRFRVALHRAIGGPTESSNPVNLNKDES